MAIIEDTAFLRKVLKETIKNAFERYERTREQIFIPVGVSNRHVHLCQEDVEKLFGEGYKLKMFKPLSQPGNYAAEEKVVLVGPKGVFTDVRVLGPVRKYTQVELLIGDGYKLGLDLPVRESGCTDPSPSLTIVGPKGAIKINQGVMAAARHIHMSTSDAEQWGVKDGDLVRVRTTGIRSLVFNNVKVRLNDEYITELHLDIEEANAAAIKQGDLVELLLD